MIDRYELKFLLDPAQRVAVEEVVVPRLELDEHGQAGRYAVNSVYYDSPDLRWLHEKLDGLNRRHKVRLRWYGGPIGAAEQGFLEIKHRHGRRVLKERVTLASPQRLAAEPQLLQEPAAWGDLGADPRQVAGRASHLARQLALQPTVLIRYQRRAFVAPLERRLRITFDEAVQAYAGEDTAFAGEARSLLPAGWAVLEVKFDQLMPSWTRSALISLGLRLQPFSKYAEGVLALRGAPSHALSPGEVSARPRISEAARDADPVDPREPLPQEVNHE